MVNKIVYVSSVQFYGTSSVCCMCKTITFQYVLSMYNYMSRFHGPSLVHGFQAQSPPPADQDRERASCTPSCLGTGGRLQGWSSLGHDDVSWRADILCFWTRASQHLHSLKLTNANFYPTVFVYFGRDVHVTQYSLLLAHTWLNKQRWYCKN